MAHGHIIYHNESRKAVEYFAKIGYQCPEFTNPADYFMNIMSIESIEMKDTDDAEELVRRKTELERDYQSKIKDFVEKYEQSELRNDPDDIHPEAYPLKGVDHKTYQAGIIVQFWYLFLRTLRNNYRLPLTSYIKIISTIIQAIMILLVYGKLDHDQQSIQSRNGLLFFTCMMNFFNPLTNITLIFPDERPVYIREQGSNQYGPTAYLLAKI